MRPETYFVEMTCLCGNDIGSESRVSPFYGELKFSHESTENECYVVNYNILSGFGAKLGVEKE
jgi:hypothetical protein